MRNHLILAHVVKTDPRYAKFYLDRAIDGNYIIVDNGAAENDTPCTTADLLQAVHVTTAAELVCPDVIKDSKGTIDATLEFLATYQSTYPNGQHRLMVVPQGENSADCMACLRAIMSQAPRSPRYVIGIPKHLGYDGHARIEFIKRLRSQGHRQPIHLLGFATNPRVELRLASAVSEHLNIRSIDTSLPFGLGQRELKLTIATTRDPLGLRTDFDLVEDNEYVEYNVQTLLGWMQEDGIQCNLQL